MQWLNPAGAWALLGLLPVIALYLLRKRAKRTPVPSLLLWRRAEEPFRASKPFQRLRSKLLLWLQLLLVVLLSIALMRPAAVGGVQGEAVLVFDLSASMKTITEGHTRLDSAKEQAYQMLNGFHEENAITVLAAGEHFSQTLVRSRDLAAVRGAIRGLQAQNSSADVEGAVALALAMQRDLPDLQIYVLSDCYVAASPTVNVLTAGKPTPNRSILSLRLSRGEEGVSAFAQVQNLGPETNAEMECYADGVLCDLRTIALPENAKQSVHFLAPANASRVTVRFSQADALPEDDARYAAVQAPVGNQALLVTQGNVFLEHALALRAGLTVVKAAKADAEAADGFDLYVYDGLTPEKWPETGAVLAIAPSRELLGLSVGKQSTMVGKLRAGTDKNAQAICENLLLTSIAIRAYQPVLGGHKVLETQGNALLSINEQDSRRAAVLGFDLHDSNLPLQADFPVLMQNLLHYLLPDSLEAAVQANCGNTIVPKLNERTVSAHVNTPSGRKAALVGQALTDTDEIGLYTLEEAYADGSTRQTAFALHIPPEESDTNSVAPPQTAQAHAQAPAQGAGREWTPLILLLCFAVLLLEWEVSRRGA
ncbi:MAG: BatA and WFA domain-containing protein [Clostridia bacterium]